MTVIGIDISGGKASVVILMGTRSDNKHLQTETKRLELAKYPSEKADITTISTTLNALIDQHQIEMVVFKKYPINGKFSSGLAIHWQGVFASTLKCPIKFVAAQTITATNKKQKEDKKYPNIKYLSDAYDLAFEALI